MFDVAKQKQMIMLYLLITLSLNSIALGVESNEVIFYEDPGFSGYSFNWSLEPGMRHLTSETFYGYPSSIEVGSDVKVAVYRHLAFCGPSAVFEDSTSYVGNYWNDEISSFIIFPKDQALPLGVKFSDTDPYTVSGSESVSQFFSLPDYLYLDERYYGEDFCTFVYDEPDYKYVLIQGDGVEAELFAGGNFDGFSIILPPRTNVCSDDAEREFDGYKYYGLSGCVLKHAASLKVRWIGPKERSSAIGTSSGEFIPEPVGNQTSPTMASPTGDVPWIVDVSWQPQNGVILVMFDRSLTELWSEEWEMYIDDNKMPVVAPQGYPNFRPNAELDKNPTCVFIGTLPWLTSLYATDFPCCGTIKFCIPGKGCTNEMSFNLLGEGCRTASPKNCSSLSGTSDVISGFEVGIVSIFINQTSPSTDSGIMLEENIDRPGMNYKSYVPSSADPLICANDCANDPICKAFTYVKPGFRGSNSCPECWLKNGVPDPIFQEYCISGVK